ncbi:integumentary mucin C.1-like [Schistocerca serialis cubense]|uniref:integumentary mucin C.1-like n=1 Tax=Schistocerca serialis cubense TaxID=2023355 RepID=UPI00214E0CAE|nr:integumentary mucin C.1-like [Schistocerca serialis cubense]
MEVVKDITETAAVDLGDLLDAGDCAVVTLTAGDTRLLAHRAVLADRSPVFAAMFAHDTLEASSGAVSILDVGGPVLRQLVSYLYTLRAPQLPGAAPQLLAAADKYGVSRLKAECERQVAAQLTVETAAAAAVLAVRHSCSDLRRAAIEFIKARTHEVMATQGWADAMRKQPEDLIEVSRLLYDPPLKSSTPAVTATTATATTTTDATTTTATTTTANAPRQTPAAAALPTSPPPGEATVSRMRPPAATRLRPTTTTTTAVATAATTSTTTNTNTATAATTTTAGTTRQTPTAAAAPPTTPAPDHATVSHLRSLSAKERGRRLVQAAEVGSVGQLRALIAAGADVGARGEAHGHAEVAAALLVAGADRGATTRGGRTALDFVGWCNHRRLVEMLS